MDEQGIVRYIFALVIKKLFAIWKHVIVGLFEVNDTTRHGLARQLKVMLKKFGLTFKILSCWYAWPHT
jgi:hypothetical protein